MMILFGIAYYSIWITPIIFVASLIRAIQAIHEGESPRDYTILAAISFWLIVVPFFFILIEG